jgi:hypothetical protein
LVQKRQKNEIGSFFYFGIVHSEPGLIEKCKPQFANESKPFCLVEFVIHFTKNYLSFECLAESNYKLVLIKGWNYKSHPVEVVKAKEQEFRRISEQDQRKMFFLFKILIEKNR